MKNCNARGWIDLIKEDKGLWDLFTRAEEYSSDRSDQYGRFPYNASNNKSILEPRVSEYLISKGLKIRYPEDRKFAVCLTHDVDIINLRRKEYFGNSINALMGGNPRNSVGYLRAGLDDKSSPLKNFNHIISLEEKYNSKSTFFFQALRQEDEHHNYDLGELKCEIQQIEERGWEVGLHGGHGAYDNLEVILEEKRMLESVSGSDVIGYRNHYLRFKTPDTWELLSKAGFRYDTTFGFNEMVGFRNGMCYPFKPFNLRTGREIDILEIPLTMMDVTFPRFLKYSLSDAWDLTKRLINVTEKYNGVMTVLWHNDQMTGEMAKFYRKILEYCKEKDAWMASGKEVYTWWIDEQLSLN
jgi:peptidoglycan/xylan/chitin deacetylase (PgdA/CDA1 family)